ncbi:MAG TPA: tRNA lysidine(34) synthetase TilS [Firmicutes bacterium]|nr:tRNA lysidine(34) synthetase TilS [Bacillota bacterium]
MTRKLILPRQRVLVALSGGPDSSVLLHLLWRLAREEEWQWELASAHLNHCLRGEEARADEEKARRLAETLAVPFYVERVEVAALARERGISLEAAGRLARYRFFDQLATRLGCDRVALGHHLDDQAETILLHLLQGTGLRGLTGMSWLRENRYVRPLLSTRRQEIEDYLAAWGWEPARDRSNTEVTWLRNRIRQELLPLLEQEYSPAIRVNLVRLAEVAREEDEFLEATARHALTRLEVSCEGRPAPDPGAVSWRLLPFAELPVALQRRVLRQLVRRLLEGRMPRDWGFTTTERWRLALLAPVAGDAVVRDRGDGEDGIAYLRGDLPGGLRWELKGERVRLWRVAREEEGQVGEEALDLPVPGSVSWGVRGETIIRASLEGVEATGSGSGGQTAGLPPRGRWEALLDADLVAGGLRVRSWRPGDRVAPPGMAGHKKLQDLFVDAKIPREWRSNWPVVVDEVGIVWVPGLAVDRRVVAMPGSRRVVRLRWSGPQGDVPTRYLPLREG